MQKKVDILLACYNGEKYIYNQLLSLQQQTHTNWHLHIRDDGSTDNTLNIINEFIAQDDRITLIKDDKKGLGAALNFKELFNYVTSEYVICCDQDDIWFEKKLELLLNEAQKKFENNKPCIVYCDGYGYDSNKGIITIESISTLHATSLNEFLFFNAGYQGCSILMNHTLAQIFREYKESFYMHDNIISLIAHTLGKVSFLPLKLMLYRQHSNNVTGNIGPYSLYHKVFKARYPVISRIHLEEKKHFYNQFQTQISTSDRTLFQQYFLYSNTSNTLSKLKIIYQNKFTLGQYKYALYFKTLIRPTLDKK